MYKEPERFNSRIKILTNILVAETTVIVNNSLKKKNRIHIHMPKKKKDKI